MPTFFPGEGDIVRKWHIVDASGQTLGRLSSRVARILAGKDNPQYTPFIDTVRVRLVIPDIQTSLFDVEGVETFGRPNTRARMESRAQRLQQ